ncbi:hypothetical protein [Novosphingobium sp. ST904]|uniref:hypothetical protein n=1 Tax=Novosphingobium sp. ST904 TaxID=1684385 RepID=UPI0006C86192|nr:hypothetical protein [Novosphingobium sp. ST904]KPH62325.1 hypothetical protein ADT71_15415 [Novosphingobium sp. ST904]TCM43332.1 hypothetical protein EDF59_101436 [Novosphingobium sp. ST904]
MGALPLAAIAKSVLSWAWGAIWRHRGVIALGIAAIALWAECGQLTAERDAANQKAAAEKTAHQRTKDDYRAAQAEAARLDAERIAREMARQQEINDAASKDYAQRLAALRARYQRLLDGAKAGSPAGSASAGIAVPGLPASPGGTAQAPDIRLAGAPAECLGPSERLIAAEQAMQLDALIAAVVALGEGRL